MRVPMSHDDDPRWKYKLDRISKASHPLGLLVAAIIVISEWQRMQSGCGYGI